MKKIETRVVEVLIIASIALFFISFNSVHNAYAHSTVDREAIVKEVDNYQVAFQLYPKFASAGQNATLHFSLMEKDGSNVNGIFAAMVMKEKDGTIVKQVPYRYYEFGDISIPYTFSHNEDYAVTLMTRISGDSEYMSSPLAVDFDISVRPTTTMSTDELLLMVIPFMSALIGGFVFLFKKWK
jgi:hypothetical protein